MAKLNKRFVIVVATIKGEINGYTGGQEGRYYVADGKYRGHFDAEGATTFKTEPAAKKHLKMLVAEGKADARWSVIPTVVTWPNDYVG